MTGLAAAPLALLAAGAVACLLLGRSLRAQQAIALVTSVALVAIAVLLLAAAAADGPLRLQVGGWPAPAGIRLEADVFSALMVLVTAVLAACVAVFSLVDVPRAEAAHGFYPLVLLLLLGVSGAFLTADLFNLYVWFELMLIASFVLVALGGTRDRLRGGLIYVTLSLVGSALFLIGVGLVYSAVQTLDFDQAGARLSVLAADEPYLVTALQATLLVSFAIKAAVFPVFFWLPDSYHTPPPAVSALFAGLLTKVGVYALIRVTVAIFPESDPVQSALGAVAALTMVIGVMGALAQESIRRILSFHIVSQIGYMVAGLALASGAPEARRFALAAAIFYVIHHILVKANLFLVAGLVRHVRGTGELARLGGLARTHPWLALLFLVPAFSLAGVPPLSGFWAKLSIIQAGLDEGASLLVAAAVVAGVMTLISMTKIWVQAFGGEPPRQPAPPAPPGGRLLLAAAPSALLGLLTAAIGLWPEPLFSLAIAAAGELIPQGAAP